KKRPPYTSPRRGRSTIGRDADILSKVRLRQRRKRPSRMGLVRVRCVNRNQAQAMSSSLSQGKVRQTKYKDISNRMNILRYNVGLFELFWYFHSRNKFFK